MTQPDLPNYKLRLPPQGLMMQLVAIILLPLTLILLVVTFGSIAVHQNAMRTMVGQRDERAVSTAASALGAQLDLRMRELDGLRRMIASSAKDPAFENLASISSLENDFDQGIGIIDARGELVSTLKDSPFTESYFDPSQSVQPSVDELVSTPGRMVLVNSPVDGSPVGLISYPISDLFYVIGAFNISIMAENTLKDVLPASSHQSVLLVDENKRVLYKAGEMIDFTESHPGIAEGLQGRSGTVFVKQDGDEHVSAYSAVTPAGWVLVTEEAWEEVSTPVLRTSQLIPLLLVPALLIMSVALWFAARQIIQPLRTLEAKAAKLAEGDFSAIRTSAGGIAEIRRLQYELVKMAHKVQEAQSSLHGYIGSITAAQEEERRRLARELHDDTLQALIALKQRVQLAQLQLEPVQSMPDPTGSELDEIASLTEVTIQNLRRLTRDLRPIYLEDLGLVPSLEMLAREASQGMGIPVSFQRLGTERRLDANAELALYRIAQEGLNNISRHAQANTVSLDLEYSSIMVTLQVKDNGVGFRLPDNPSEFAVNGHFGLVGLYERAGIMGATLEINTAPGKGTNLTVTLPT